MTSAACRTCVETRRNMAGRGKRKCKSSAAAEVKRARTDPVDSKEDSEVDSNMKPESSVPQKVRDEVQRLYKLCMPDDFYHFWDFCNRLNPENPQAALQENVGLRLVGPYDIVSGKHKLASSTPDFNLHWRHFYDPPEFQTVLQGDAETLQHLGYYRDAPDSLPVCVGENEAKKGCTITQMGENLFAAVLLLIARRRRVGGGRVDEALEKLEAELKKEAENLHLPLEQKTKAMKQRDKKVVTKTFHSAGIVVPVDKNDVGYRELPETDAGLKKLCKAIDEAENDEERMKAFAPLQEIMTFVQFANDECDYGMGYELGIDLFCYGSRYFSKVVGQLLPMAYSLLQRGVFSDIIQAHLAKRSHDDLDQLASAT